MKKFWDSCCYLKLSLTEVKDLKKMFNGKYFNRVKNLEQLSSLSPSPFITSKTPSAHEKKSCHFAKFLC